MDGATLLKEAMTLSEGERLILAARLMETLDSDDDGIDEGAFAAEIQRRTLEIDEGKAELMTWNQVKGQED